MFSAPSAFTKVDAVTPDGRKTSAPFERDGEVVDADKKKRDEGEMLLPSLHCANPAWDTCQRTAEHCAQSSFLHSLGYGAYHVQVDEGNLVKLLINC